MVSISGVSALFETGSPDFYVLLPGFLPTALLVPSNLFPRPALHCLSITVIFQGAILGLPTSLDIFSLDYLINYNEEFKMRIENSNIFSSSPDYILIT